ncbi:MAG TPA: ATP-binding protein [Selenomonadales bacterium]|nr:ATP-binding protein [Selenomonadales bacterium]
MMSGSLSDYITHFAAMDSCLSRVSGRLSSKARILLSVYDRFGCYRFVSSSAGSVLGLRAEDIIGQHWTSLGPPSAGKAAFSRDLQAVLTSGKTISGEISTDDSGGLPAYYEYTIEGILSPEGSPEGAACIAIDITDSKLQELAARNIADSLSKMMALCPIGIFTLNKEAIVTSVNRAYCEKFLPDLSEADVVGRHATLIAEKIGLGWEESASFRSLQGETVANLHVTVRGYDVLINTVPIRNQETGDIEGVLAFIHDITEYEKLKREMSRLDKLTLIGEMAAGVAHEIRNPLTVVKGYLQRFQLKCPAELKDQYGLVLSELGRVEAIITDFLSLAGNKTSALKRQDLNDIIRELQPLLAADAAEHGVALQVELSPKPALLLLDEKEIKQLILNLVRNGTEATEGKGMIRIITQVKKKAIELIVNDGGVGIPPELMNKIFNPFFTTKQHGTGLGLSVCAGIVKRHGGSLEVKSTPNQGTSFIVRFNLAWDMYRSVQAASGR